MYSASDKQVIASGDAYAQPLRAEPVFLFDFDGERLEYPELTDRMTRSCWCRISRWRDRWRTASSVRQSITWTVRQASDTTAAEGQPLNLGLPFSVAGRDAPCPATGSPSSTQLTLTPRPAPGPAPIQAADQHGFAKTRPSAT